MDLIDDQRIAQQIGNDVLVIGVVRHQAIRQSQRPRFPQCGTDRVVLKSRFHRRDGQKRDPPRARLFQIFDQIFGVFRVCGHDVLLRSSQSRFDRDVVFRFRADQRRDDAFDPGGDALILFGGNQQAPDRRHIALVRFLDADDEVFLCRQHGDV